jgi:cytochrome P450
MVTMPGTRQQQSTEPVRIPVERRCPFDPPELYAELRDERPIARLRLPGGQLGWLVTRHADARAILADTRLTPWLSLITPQTEPPAKDAGEHVPPGTFSVLEHAEHARYRKYVSGYFTRARVRAREPMIQRTARTVLAAMIRAGAPADLHSAFAQPLVTGVTCELLGVPTADRADYLAWTSTMLSGSAPHCDLELSTTNIYRGMADLVTAKRKEPDDGLISDLVHGDHGLSDEEMKNIAALLLITGLETTVQMFGLGLFALFQNPTQLTAVRTGSVPMANAVEELMRYLSSVQYGITRVAHEDLEIGDLRMLAGETVVVSVAAANRDPAVFPDPDTLDVHRGTISHLAFGHGAHLCLGAPLARAELQIGYRLLFDELPGLRLAVPAERVETAIERPLYGVRTLPITWDDTARKDPR